MRVDPSAAKIPQHHQRVSAKGGKTRERRQGRRETKMFEDQQDRTEFWSRLTSSQARYSIWNQTDRKIWNKDAQKPDAFL